MSVARTITGQLEQACWVRRQRPGTAPPWLHAERRAGAMNVALKVMLAHRLKARATA